MIVEVKVLNQDTGEEQTLYKVDSVYGDITFSSREDAEKFIDNQINLGKRN